MWVSRNGPARPAPGFGSASTLEANHHRQMMLIESDRHPVFARGGQPDPEPSEDVSSPTPATASLRPAPAPARAAGGDTGPAR